MKISKINEEEFFEQMYELIDIEEIIHTDEYINMYDISLEDSDRTFILANGIITHNSARSGLMPILGRQDNGFYELKGKPLNSYDATVKKFTENKELTELLHIIKKEEYEYVIFGTDQDLDGFSIRGLLLGFFHKYLPDLLTNNRIGTLNTPIVVLKKNNKIKHWYYSMNDVDESKYKTHESKYYKGLGTWENKDLQYIIEKDGFEKMVNIFDYNKGASDEIIDDWLSGDKSDKRKEFIAKNEFDLIKL